MSHLRRDVEHLSERVLPSKSNKPTAEALRGQPRQLSGVCARRCGFRESQNWSETLLYQCRGERAGKTRSQTEMLHDVGPDNESNQTRQCSVAS